MKIILSRKGFDSSYGGIASPILPDNSLLSLPIPYSKGIRFSDVTYEGKDLLAIINELKRKSWNDRFCHLDPDINDEIKSKDYVCKGLFGQSGAAQSHLDNQDVSEGDIFLFYGWFKQTEMKDGRLKFIKGARDQHVIFGYLQIGKIYCNGTFPENMKCHPHAKYRELEKGKNCIYQAKDRLSFDEDLPGYGVFRYDKQLVLTKDNNSRSKWDLPDFFKYVEISYHSKKNFKEGYFDSAKIGQEFVIKCNEKVEEWAKQLIKENR